ncbi:MAG: alpha/beta hydrolase [Pseudomonadota bacterium]
MQLDPDYARLAAPLDDYEADWVNGVPDTLRKAYSNARAALDGDVHPECTITPFPETAPVRGLRFQPESDTAKPGTAIVFFHGGSFTVGSPETHKVMTSYLAAETGLPVYSIDYGLAPEHPYPSQREEGVRAVEAVLTGVCDASGRGPERLLLAGDSAGAAICFWVDAKLDDEPRSKIDGILAIYGAFGADRSNSSANGEAGSGLSKTELDAALARLGNPADLADDPVFRIVASARMDGPPCYLAAAALDPVCIDSEVLHTRLTEGGRDTVLDIAPGLPHGYMHFVARVPAVRAAFDRAVEWIRAIVT